MQKMKSKRGFTLIEMLIVVAIIGILIAVSIPLVSSSLEKARIATDTANERAAKAAALVIYLGSDLKDADADSSEVTVSQLTDTSTDVFYDAAAGKMVATTKPTNGYGKCSEHQEGVLQIFVKAEDGTVTAKWVGDKVKDDGDPHIETMKVTS